MKYVCLFVLVLCTAVGFSYGQETTPSGVDEDKADAKSLKRVVRQTMPSLPQGMPGPPEGMPSPPDGMPSMPNMKSYEASSRKRREAKGVSGSLPTRRG